MSVTTTDWMDRAACRNLNPRLFDATTIAGAARALQACSGCPVVALCRAEVRPARSHFDGVCAGEVWSNGRPVTAETPNRGGRPLAPATRLEQSWTVDELRRAHRLHGSGVRTPDIVEGERVYQRQKSRASRARKATAA